MARLVSEVYGDALYELALEEKEKSEGFYEEAKTILEILKDNPNFIQVMSHPNISGEEKNRLLDEIFKGKISDEFLGLFHELEIKGHFKDVIDVIKHYLKKEMPRRQIGEAVVTTPMALSEDKKSKVYEKLIETTGYKKINIDYKIDSSLIGGMVIRIGDRVVDSSIKSKLKHLSFKLSKIQLKVGESDS